MKATVAREEVIWHDVECGAYAADLPLWRELAERAPGPVLEIGAGTGRVALDLARRGHRVAAVEPDPVLAEALRERAAARDLELEVRVADVRELQTPERFGLVAAPMQVMQLLDGAGGRRRALEAMAACVAPAGVVAVAIVEGVPAGGGAIEQPLPDVAEHEGWVYSSLPLALTDEGGRMLVTRLRQIVSPGGELTEELDETRLDVLGADGLEQEAAAVGLAPAGRRRIATTVDHVGSTLVLLEAG